MRTSVDLSPAAPAPAPVEPGPFQDPAPALSQATGALADLTRKIGQRWVDYMWQAARAAVECEAKIASAYNAVLNNAKLIYDQLGVDLELDSYSVLAAAREMAAALGCPPVSQTELMSAPAPTPGPFGSIAFAPPPLPVIDPVPPVVPGGGIAGDRPGGMPELPALLPPDLQPQQVGLLPGQPPGPAAGPAAGAPFGPAVPGLAPTVSPVVLPLPVLGLVPPILGAQRPGGIVADRPGGAQPTPAFPPRPGGPVPGLPTGRPPELPGLAPPARPGQVVPNPTDRPPVGDPPGRPGGPVGDRPGGAVPTLPMPALEPPPAALPPQTACPPIFNIDLNQLLQRLCPPGPAGGEVTAPPGGEGPGGTEPLEQSPGEVAPPTPEEEKPPPARPGGPLILDFESDRQCRTMLQSIAQIARQIQDIALGQGVSDEQAIRRRLETWVDERVSGLPVIVRWLPKTVLGLVVGGFMWAARRNVLFAGCTDELSVPAALSLAIVDLLERWFGLGLGDLKRRIQRVGNFACPTDIPTLAEAVQQYLAGAIPKEVFHCLARANNRTPESADRTAWSSRTRPGVLDNIALFFRNQLTLDQLKVRLSELGVLDLGHVNEYLTLASFTPPPSDLPRFMVRDVFDEDVVKAYGYDDDFDKKFTGKALEFARANGMTADQFRYYWRAHWDLPSPTQGYTMLHRLRPGRVAEELVTTREQLKELLQIKDMAPRWVDRMIAISHTPLRLVDLRNAYFRGAIQADEVKAQLLDRGYNERDATIVARFFDREKVRYWVGQSAGKDYIAGLSTSRDLADELLRQGLRDPVLSQVKEELSKRRDLAVRSVCLKEIKKRYLSHEIDETRAWNELQTAGFGPAEAEELRLAWGCQRPRRSKELSAAQLCQLVELGLVDWQDATRRLVSMGYGREDATRIMDQCQIRIREGQLAKQQRAQKAAQAASEREAKKAEQLARQTAATADKAAKERRKTMREAEKREAKIAKLAVAASAASGRPYEEELANIDAAAHEFARTEGLTVEAALDLVEQAIASVKGQEGGRWASALVALGRRVPPIG